ncbi:MAG: TolB family protein [Candidatus Xenobia bacterium]
MPTIDPRTDHAWSFPVLIETGQDAPDCVHRGDWIVPKGPGMDRVLFNEQVTPAHSMSSACAPTGDMVFICDGQIHHRRPGLACEEILNSEAPQWVDVSPDGTCIASIEQPAGQAAQLRLANIHGATMKAFQDPLLAPAEVHFSADGKTLFCTSDVKTGLVSVDVASGHVSVLESTPCGSASVSRDGSSLAYLRYDDDCTHLMLRDLSKGTTRELSRCVDPATTAFSPDGKRLILVVHSRDEEASATELQVFDPLKHGPQQPEHIATWPDTLRIVPAA